MRRRVQREGLTVRAIAGTHTVLLAFDLAPVRRPGCLGFALQRTELSPAGQRARAVAPAVWLTNRLRFPQDAAGALEAEAEPALPPAVQADEMLVDFRPPTAVPVAAAATTDRAPWQAFRYLDSGVTPGRRYRYVVSAQYGRWDRLESGPRVQLTVTTEDPGRPETAVFFNRAAASSQAYVELFGDADPDELQPPSRGVEARAWLARGLEDGLLAFLAQAAGPGHALHAALYEFQKPRLLEALAAARARGVDVRVVYHQDKPADHTAHTGRRNAQAAAQAGLTDVCAPRTRQSAISHNKFVVWLKAGAPRAVWTGSTNWTDGAFYGQLNVGQAVTDAAVAARYERYFQLLHADTPRPALVEAVAELNVLPEVGPGRPGAWAVFSPDPRKTEAGELVVIERFADFCRAARCVLVCAPFALHPRLAQTLLAPDPPGVAPADQPLRFLLLNMENNLGAGQAVSLIDGRPGREVSVAVTLRSPLHDFQNRLVAGPESFRHQGIHVHAKFILADPFGDDPALITGSANFSNNSTAYNDENVLILRGRPHRAVADIYLTEFFRMFDSYSFRGKQHQRRLAGQRVALAEDDSWTRRHYEPDEHRDTDRILSRQLMAGTLPAPRPQR